MSEPLRVEVLLFDHIHMDAPSIIANLVGQTPRMRLHDTELHARITAARVEGTALYATLEIPADSPVAALLREHDGNYSTGDT